MKCWCLLLAAVFTFRSNATGAAFANSNALNLVSSFLRENGINFVVFIDCGATGTGIGLECVAYEL
jgi:hypothetical protein